jgi:hypothetical protein
MTMGVDGAALATALVPIQVDGWMLFGDGTDYWIKDVDLAARAELANERDIRTHIKKANEEGLLAEIGVAGGDANNGAYFRTVTEVVSSGKGRSQPVRVYYLNREAAVLITMRLKTKKAVQLQVAVVRVFLMAVDGKIARPAPEAPALAAARLAALEAESTELARLKRWLRFTAEARARTMETSQELDDEIAALAEGGNGSQYVGWERYYRAAREIAEDYHIFLEHEVRGENGERAVRDAAAALEARALQERAKREAAERAEEAREAAKSPTTPVGKAIVAAAERVRWRSSAGRTLRFLATQCDEAGALRIDYARMTYAQCMIMDEDIAEATFRKNCERLRTEGWLRPLPAGGVQLAIPAATAPGAPREVQT